jgi:hypothetical protein
LHHPDRFPAFDRRALVQHGAKESGKSGGKKRNHHETQDRIAKLGLIVKIATIVAENSSD